MLASAVSGWPGIGCAARAASPRSVRTRDSSSTPITPNAVASSRGTSMQADRHVGLARDVVREHPCHSPSCRRDRRRGSARSPGSLALRMSRFWYTASAVPWYHCSCTRCCAGMQVDEFLHAAVEEAPAALDMADQAVRLVLRGDADAADAGIDAVGQRKIDDAELAAERHGRLGAPVGEILQPAAAAAGENQRIRVLGDDADEADIGVVRRRARSRRSAIRLT